MCRPQVLQVRAHQYIYSSNLGRVGESSVSAAWRLIDFKCFNPEGFSRVPRVLSQTQGVAEVLHCTRRVGRLTTGYLSTTAVRAPPRYVCQCAPDLYTVVHGYLISAEGIGVCGN